MNLRINSPSDIFVWVSSSIKDSRDIGFPLKRLFKSIIYVPIVTKNHHIRVRKNRAPVGPIGVLSVT